MYHQIRNQPHQPVSVEPNHIYSKQESLKSSQFEWFHGTLFRSHLTVERVGFNMILRACHLIGHVKNAISTIQRLPFKKNIYLVYSAGLSGEAIALARKQISVEYKTNNVEIMRRAH